MPVVFCSPPASFWRPFVVLRRKPALRSAVHQLLAGVVNALDDVVAARVAEIQAKLDAARGGTYAKLHELRQFLGLKE